MLYVALCPKGDGSRESVRDTRKDLSYIENRNNESLCVRVAGCAGVLIDNYKVIWFRISLYQ